ncbi:Rho GTPase activation protein [Phycomyces blakesleeanus]
MSDRRSGMVQSIGYHHTGSIVSRAVAAAAANNHHSSRRAGRGSRRYSVSVFYSMAAEQDIEVEDELAKAQRSLRELKTMISVQSKKNFTREHDVRFLDARIGLLIQSRMALEEQNEVVSRLEEHDEDNDGHYPGNLQMQQYGNLFYLLQSEPRHIATLCRLVSLSEIDSLLQTVMFTLYGNQYESREEHLLLTMFQNVLAWQFETTPEFSSLLRANTPVSRMMTTYTRRGPGQSYLKSLLSERINELIVRKDANLQINPLKVYAEIIDEMESMGTLPEYMPRSVTPEVAAANPQVQAMIKPRLEALLEVADGFLSTIIHSLDQIPYGIRWICKQIRSLTMRKYPNATDDAISSLIGGFFFLRFVNPAIVTPQAYMLVDGLPGIHPRTTVTLIAKMIQNLANKPSYAKETYMIPTNSFVENNKARTSVFLNELCEVGDFYESLEMDQYMALSKKDIMISITPNEIYATQALLEQHLQVLAPKPNDHLRLLMCEVGPAPPQVPRKENKPLDLSLFSRWEMPIQDLTMTLMSENNITQNDILYMETKAIFVQIIRTIPTLARQPLRLAFLAEAAGTSKDAQLVTKGIKVKEMLRELETVGIVDPKDGHRFLAQEITQELAHLGDLKLKVVKELESLESVYKTIQDHNNYLRGQLESYRAYLQNVRFQTSGGNKSNNTKQVGIGVEVVEAKTNTKKQAKVHVQGPFKFTHQQLEKDGVIVATEVLESIRVNVYLTISSPLPGTFIIELNYRGRDKPILEIDLKLDDLLEKQQYNIPVLDLEYLKLNVGKTLQLLTKSFLPKSKTGFFS